MKQLEQDKQICKLAVSWENLERVTDKLGELDEEESKINEKVSRGIIDGKIILKYVTGTRRDHLEREIWRDHKSLLNSRVFLNRPKLESDQDIIAFLDFYEKIKSFAYSKTNTPTLWFCCWSIDTRRVSSERKYLEVLSKALIPAFLYSNDVFGLPKAGLFYRMEQVRLAAKVAHHALRLQGRDPERANYFPTIYLGYGDRDFSYSDQSQEGITKRDIDK